MPDNANLGKIFGTALVGVAEDLVEAKEKGQQLPGLLDKLAGLAADAKSKGINVAKDVLKEKVKEYIPYAVAGVLAIIVLILIFRHKSN